MKRLGNDFYENPSVTEAAKSLLGKILFTDFEEGYTSGIIVETEAYEGITDRASHAWNGRRTKRNEPMYGAAGTAYVYLCYGLHQMFNVVTNGEGIPHAILIRAIEPLEGIPLMLERRNMDKLAPRISAGPGSAAAALGIHTRNSGSSLTTGPIGIWDGGKIIDEKLIRAASRVGIQYAEEDAYLPYRFSIAGNPYVSKSQGLIKP